MKLQEELMNLVNDYCKNKYQKWLDENQPLVNGLKSQMIEQASDGYINADCILLLNDDDKYYLQKWLVENCLKCSFSKTDTGVNNPLTKYKLQVTWYK